MKSIERQKLKQNEFARTVAHAREALQARQSQVAKIVAAVAVILALAAGYSWWRSARAEQANELLATALAAYEKPVVPPQPPAPGSPPPVPQPGTYQSEQERLEASLPMFLEAATSFPDSRAGLTARFHAAAIQAALGRHAEAEANYRQVVDKADGIYARTARLGLAEAQVAQQKYDEAIAVYTELTRDSTTTLPLDGILMRLGRAYERAGKTDDAVRSFTRIVDEFPQSPYAADARREIEEARKS